MMLEIRHLKTLQAIRECGTLSAAATRLHLTPSALSHQIRELEHLSGLPLLMRKTRPVTLTPAGLRLLKLADQVLPFMQQAERELRQMAAGQVGQLVLASECHSCFDWLMPMLNEYRQVWPQVELDFANGFEPEPHQLLQQGEIDLLLTNDRQNYQDLDYLPLFDYECRLIAAPNHTVLQQTLLTAEQAAQNTWITYPVELKRLDFYRHWLEPRHLTPQQVRAADLTPVLIQLVASGRGIAALPDWVITPYEQKGWISSRSIPVDPAGKLRQTVYAATRSECATPCMQGFLNLLKKHFS